MTANRGERRPYGDESRPEEGIAKGHAAAEGERRKQKQSRSGAPEQGCLFPLRCIRRRRTADLWRRPVKEGMYGKYCNRLPHPVQHTAVVCSRVFAMVLSAVSVLRAYRYD